MSELSKTNQLGLSLLELMVSMAVMALVLGFGVPSFVGVVQNNRIVTVTNDLVTTIHAARSEAVKSRNIAVICASDDPSAAVPVCGDDFASGWVAFIDRNGDGTVDANADPALDDTILRTHSSIDDSIVSSAAGGAYLAFSPSGFSRNVAALGASATSIVICDARGNKDVASGISAARVVQLTETGRPDTLRNVADVTDQGGCP